MIGHYDSSPDTPGRGLLPGRLEIVVTRRVREPGSTSFGADSHEDDGRVIVVLKDTVNGMAAFTVGMRHGRVE
jgi:hypothetical protein